MNFRILSFILLGLILVSCKKEVPTAAFTASKNPAEVDEVISFTNQSKNATSYSWDFGDGASSTSETPSHSYSTDGTFNVELSATGEGGTSTATESIVIVWPDPIADFSMDKSVVDVGELVTFTNLSENAESYSWSFGDGNTSTLAAPTHEYDDDGTFTVQLTATGPGGASNSTTQSITVEYPPPEVGFTIDKPVAAPGVIITFTNTSEYATSYSWDFGDGSTSTLENPTHAYAAVGTYTVQLTAVGDGGTSSTSQTVTIALTMTGSWWWQFYLNGILFNGPFELVEHSDGSLTGTFDFSDGSGFENIEPTSNITGDAVLIEVDHNPEYDLYMSFRGTANAGRDNMTGSIYINSTYIGSYTASKTTKKSAPANNSNDAISDKDRLLDAILKE